MASDWGFFLHQLPNGSYRVGAYNRADKEDTIEDRTKISKNVPDSDGTWAYFLALQDCFDLIEERGAWVSYEECRRVVPEIEQAESFWQKEILRRRTHDEDVRRRVYGEGGQKDTRRSLAWGVSQLNRSDGYSEVWLDHHISGVGFLIARFSTWKEADGKYDDDLFSALSMLTGLLTEQFCTYSGEREFFRMKAGRIDERRSWKDAINMEDAQREAN